jgi:hypothetical protein
MDFDLSREPTTAFQAMRAQVSRGLFSFPLFRKLSMNIEMWKHSDIRPYEKNLRINNPV